MSLQLTIRNRQRVRAIDVRLFREVVRQLLAEIPPLAGAKLGVFILAAPEMTRLNETYLRHAGATDVIAFDYSEPAAGSATGARRLHGEIFVCLDEAIRQARQFRTRWPAELVRYVIHGVLHLLGHDDQRTRSRRRMKREENRLLRQLAARFPLSRLAGQPRLRP